MADGASRPRMTTREFLDWEARQERKHEFEDGLIYMMAAGTQRHELIKGNVFAELRRRLKGKPCRPFGSDLQVRTSPGPIYYPDLTVDCGPPRDESVEADQPTVIFEVLSASTRTGDIERKLPNYQATPSVKEIVYVETERMLLMVWRRGDEGAWEESEVTRPDEALELSSVSASLTFAEIYEGVGW